MSEVTTRYRPIKTKVFPTGNTKVDRFRVSTQKWENQTHFVGTENSFELTGSQSTRSEGHRWPPIKGDVSDIGGGFRTIKQYVDLGSTNYAYLDEKPLSGTFSAIRHDARPRMTTRVTSGSSVNFPSSLESSDATLITKGATAIANCAPTQSAAEVSTALGELVKEGLPQLPGVQTWQERTSRAKAAGGEHLNVEFGWKPLISEVQSIAAAAAKSQSILEQYRRDEGRLVRRSYTFPEEQTITRTNLGTALPWGVPTLGSAWPSAVAGDWSRIVTTSKRCWFKGAFVYGNPPGLIPEGTFADTVAEADRLFGVSLTPDVLWNLAPWSWAIDWFSNAGDVLTTLGDYISQGLIMKYGYVMEHTVHKHEYFITGARVNGSIVSMPSSSVVTETKKRVRANPFGFGLTWDGLSPSQLGILAALGISRS